MSIGYLVDLIGRIGHWGYGLLFLGAMLESAAMIGVLVPGEALVLAAGFFAAQGAFDLDALIVTVAVGATVGDSLGYEMGRHWGRDFLTEHGRRFGLTEEKLKRVDGFFERHGGASVFLGRFVGFARALVPFFAGSARMPYARFLSYNAAGALLWSIAVVLVGYFVGASWQSVEAWIGRITAILAALVALGIAFRMRERLHSVVPLDAIVLVIAVCVFGAIAEDVATHDPLTFFDTRLAEWLASHRTALGTTVMLAVTHLHDPVPATLAIAAVGFYLLRRRDYRWLTTLIATTAGGAVLNALLKNVFQRARPAVDHSGLTLSTFSFPSGHVAAATLLYGFVAAYLVFRIEKTVWRIAAVGTAFLLVALVAITRMYLGAHYLSDVLGAFAAAIAWLTLCLIVFQGRLSRWTWQRLDGEHPSDGDTP